MAATFALMEFITYTDEGVEALNKMGGSVEGYEKRLNSATQAQRDFNAAVQERVSDTIRTAKSSVSAIFQGNTTDTDAFSGPTDFVLHGITAEFQQMKTLFGSESNAILSEAQAFAQKFGKNFLSGFNVAENLLALDPAMAEEQLKTLEEYTASATRKFSSLWENLKSAGASQDVLGAYRKVVDGALNSIEDLIKKERELIALQKEASEKGVSFNVKEYKVSTEEINKATKNVSLFKDSDEKKEILDMSSSVGKLVTNLTSLQEAMNSGKLKGEEYQKQIELGNESLQRFAAKAAESGVSADDFISILIQKVPLGVEQLNFLREVMQRIANLDLSKGVDDFVKGLNTKTALLGEKAFVSDAYKFFEDKGVKQTGDELVKIIKSGNLGLLEFKNGAKLSAEEIGNINTAIDQWKSKQAAVDARKSASKAANAYESVEKSIERLNRQVDTWQAKTKESNTEKVSIQLEKYNKEIERLLRTGKASSDQIRRLEEVKVKLKEAAAAYEDYILKREKEKALDFYKSAADDYSKITGIVDPTIIQKSAQTVYEKQLDEARKFLEAKVLTQEEYNQLEVMLDAKKNDEIRRNSQDLYDNLTLAVEDYYAKYRNFATGMGEVMTMAMDGLSSAIADFATTGMTNFNQLGQAFADLANNILATINKLLAQQLVSSLFSFATDFFNPFSAGSIGSGVKANPRNIAATPSNISSMAGRLPKRWAKGGAFAGGSLSGYSNSVVSSPTIFSMGTPLPAYAKGAGLMGEAGPEAIMPLVRTPSGHLGVRSEGGGNIQQNVVINIIDQVGVNVKQKESRDNQGNTRLDLIIEQHVAQSMARQGSPTNRVLSNTYGARPALASR